MLIKALLIVMALTLAVIVFALIRMAMEFGGEIDPQHRQHNDDLYDD